MPGPPATLTKSVTSRANEPKSASRSSKDVGANRKSLASGSPAPSAAEKNDSKKTAEAAGDRSTIVETEKMSSSVGTNAVTQDGSAVADIKPKLDPRRLAFLTEPVPDRAKTKIDQKLGRAMRSIPNLTLGWGGDESVSKNPENDSLIKSKIIEHDKVSPSFTAADIGTAEFRGDKQTENTIGKKYIERIGSASVLDDKANPAVRVPSDPELLKALALRERRLNRRKARASGASPDPNDSDDSLLAELREVTDEKMFPGFDFEEISEKDYESFSNPEDPRFLLSSKGRILNPSRNATFKLDQNEELIDKRQASELCMSPKTLSRFEQSVLQKHYKHGVFTVFKGKDEMKVSHAKVLARKEIDDVRTAMAEKEAELIRLEENLAQCRIHLTKATSECSRLAKEISHIVQTAPQPKISAFAASYKHINRKNIHEEEFVLPDDPHFNQNRSFRTAREAYLLNRDLATKAAEAISVLESAIIPAEHDLAVLQLQDNRLKDLDARLLESQMKEQLAIGVVEKYKKLEVEKRKRRAQKLAERFRKEQEAKEKLEEERVKEFERDLDEKKARLRRRYEETIEQINEQKLISMQEINHSKERQERALRLLNQRVVQIRRAITKHQELLELNGVAKLDEAADSLALLNGERDLTESKVVRETRIMINNRKAAAKEEAIVAAEDRERRKMEILHKLIREEDSRRREERKIKEEIELSKALESFAPRPEQAFPSFIRSEILDRAMKKRKKELTLRKLRIKEMGTEDDATTTPDQKKPSLNVSIRLESESALGDHGASPELGDEEKGNDSSDKELLPANASNIVAGAIGSEQSPRTRFKVIRKFLPPPSKVKYHKNNVVPLLHPLPSITSTSHNHTTPFTTEPPSVIFSDYDPLKVYRKRVTFTNTSCRVNTFHLTPVPVDIASYFEVLAKPPGRMSAGMVCDVEFVFRPPSGYDQDISDGKIVFRAEFGGEFAVTIGCSTRKCLPRVSSVGGKGIMTQRINAVPELDASYYKKEDIVDSDLHQGLPAKVTGLNRLQVDFGVCVLGGTMTRTIEITNDGALQTDFEIIEVVMSNGAGSEEQWIERRAKNCSSSFPSQVNVLRNNNEDYLSGRKSGTDLSASVGIIESEIREVSNSNDSPTTAARLNGASAETDTESNFVIVKGAKGSLGGNSSQTIHIDFLPPYVEPPILKGSSRTMVTKPPSKIPTRTHYMIRFSLANVKPLIIDCLAHSLESPLILSNNEIDYGMCVVGSTYRDRLVIHNRSNIAFKFWVESANSLVRKASTVQIIESPSMKSSDRDKESINASDGIDSSNSQTLSRDELSATVGDSTQHLEECYSEEDSYIDDEQATEDSIAEVAPMFVSFDPSSVGGLQFKAPISNIKTKRKSAQKSKQNSKRSDSLAIQIAEVGEIEVSPRLAFVQPFEPFTLWFKVRPSRGANILLEDGDKGFNVPLIVKFVNQTIESPMPLRLVGTITTSDITFSNSHGASSDLNFGLCSIYETKEASLRIWNHSRLPQTAKFSVSNAALSVVYDRKEDVLPGLTVIPPLSQITKRIRFEPFENGDAHMRLVCHSIWDRKFEIICSGKGTTPLLRLSSSEIRFRTTSMGGVVAVKICVLRDKLERDSISKIKRSIDGMEDMCEEDDGDSVSFEFGTPRIVDVRTRHGGDLTSEQLEVISKKLEEGLRVESEEAINAVNKANSAAPKGSKINIGAPKSHSWTIDDTTTDLTKIFHQSTTTLSNPRIIVPSISAAHRSRTGSLPLPPAVGFSDPAPLEVRPSQGTLGPGLSAEIEITLRPPVITAAFSSSISGRELTVPGPAPSETTSGLLAVDNKAGRPTSGRISTSVYETKEKIPKDSAKTEKKRDDENVKSRINTAGTDKNKCDEDQVNAETLVSPTDRHHIVKMYQSIDDTCLTMLVPCIVRKSGPKITATSGKVEESQKDSAANSVNNLIYLRVIAPIIRPDIIILEPESGTIDYDSVPPGKSVSKQIVIYNMTSTSVKLNHQGLCAGGPFTFRHPIDLIAPNSSMPFDIVFEPKTEQRFQSDLEIFTSRTQVRIQLNGQGVYPTFALEPPEPYLFLGDVFIGDNLSKTFKISNTSNFPLQCELLLSNVVPMLPMPRIGARSHGTVNFNRQNAFSVIPPRALIPANSKQEFTVRFAPDRESDMFFDKISIDIWGSPNPCHIKVHGRCWDTSTAVIGYDQPPESREEDRRALPPKFEFEFAQKISSGSFLKTDVSAEAFGTDLSFETGGSNAGGVMGSNLTVAAGGASNPSNEAPVAKGAGKEGSDKKKNKEAAAAVKELSEEAIADLLKLTTRETVRFATVTCPWRKNELTGKWRVETRDISIANMKPANIPKPETKKPPVAEFIIEPFHGSFRYDELGHDFVLGPAAKLTVEDSMVKFVTDQTKGLVELGSIKQIKVALVNPVKDFWAVINNIKETLQITTSPTSTATPNAKPGGTAKQDHGQRSSLYANAHSLTQVSTGQPADATDPSSAMGATSETANGLVDDPPGLMNGGDSAELKSEAVTKKIGGRSMKSAIGGALSATPGGTDVSIIESRSASDTSASNEFDSPTRVESYFKITLKGGCRFVEPKGVPGPSESRIWILKIIADHTTLESN